MNDNLYYTKKFPITYLFIQSYKPHFSHTFLWITRSRTACRCFIINYLSESSQTDPSHIVYLRPQLIHFMDILSVL